MKKQGLYIVAGGTFDHFHIGHELFLKTALKSGDYLAIGITSDKMVAKKPFSHTIEPFSVRKAYVKEYLKSISHHVTIRIMKLDNPFGISVTDPNMDKIIVTKETKSNAIRINKIRIKNRLKALKIVIVPYVNADDNRKISSFRVRSGEISRHGDSYFKYLIGKQIYHLPEILRASLREPLGQIFAEKKEINRFIFSLKRQIQKNIHILYVISVGDIASLTLLDKKLIPTVMIYDLKTQREALTEKQKNILLRSTETIVLNQAGTIRKKAIISIHRSLTQALQYSQKVRIHVRGEEDLLVLPTILMAPLGSIVCYGQRGLGFIVVRVTEADKEKIKELLQKFN